MAAAGQRDASDPTISAHKMVPPVHLAFLAMPGDTARQGAFIRRETAVAPRGCRPDQGSRQLADGSGMFGPWGPFWYVTPKIGVD